MHALTMLTQDHNNVDELFRRFESLDDDQHDERRRVVDLAIEQLSVHATIEEQVFYPAIRQGVPETESDVLEALEEHHVVKWTLSELEKMAPTDERFTPKVKVLIEAVRHHATEEEEQLFPRVRDAFTNEQLVELGERLETAKKTAPTRPHPRTPDTPPLNVLLGVPVAVMDRAFKQGKDVVERVLSRR